MKYNLEVHAPSRVDALIGCRDQRDVMSFDSVLDILLKIMNNKEFSGFIESDKNKRDLLCKAEEEKTKQGLKNMLDQEPLNSQSVMFVMQQYENNIMFIHVEYMTDVLTTCFTFKEHGSDDVEYADDE